MTGEYSRRAVHASGAGLPLLYVLGLATWTQLRYLLVGLTAVVFVLEFFRLVAGWNHWIYDRLTRPYEQENVAGYALYMVSMTLVAVAFPPVAAIPGMFMLSIGDPVSGLLSTRGPGEVKQVGVLAAMFGVCFLMAAPFTVAASGIAVGAAAAAAGALGATAADGATPVVRGYVIDDNLTIPPAAAVGIWLVLWVAGIDPGLGWA